MFLSIITLSVTYELHHISPLRTKSTLQMWYS
nr:MAG TPA: hypothetical protein [Caudoviricetes sp.]